ncbi:SDR family NAD(P)-dependent oxidoreductase, partial [Chitinophaga solisilvae]|uniref:SDR family NAD(P)-dependent oxidoreductase n=1 Tax=Chitinophaga solisilvae TaxID=1233460 RepID=UPI00136D2CC5
NLLRGVKVQEDDQQYFLSRLGELWRYGLSIDWDVYYQSARRRRISLPTYSFEPVKYPVEVDPFSGSLLSVVGQGLSDSGSLPDWIYHPLWKRGLPAAAQEGKQVFLLLGAAAAFNVSLQEQLRSRGHEVVMVTPGAGYQRLSPLHYEADLLSVADYTAVLADLQSAGITLTDILYTHGLDNSLGEETLYLSLSYIAGALVSQGMMKDRRIAVVTDSLHQVQGDECGDARSAVLLGLVNVLPQEYAVNTINIDIIAATTSALPALTKELTAVWHRGDRIVALRGAHRWLCEYQQHRGEVTPGGTVLRPGGLYLVTGGLGNVGYVLSTYIRRRYNARLVLTGRRELSSLDDTAKERLRQLQSGADHCSYHAADITDEESLSRLVADIESTTGRIDGIIHTAGVIDERHFELISDITEENTQRLFSAKVSGIRVLEKVFGERRPDFIWVSSSLSAVLGGLGFSAYAAANLYMDHFLLRQQESGIRWRSVCLGGMAFSVSQIAKEQGRQRATLKPEELSQLFEWSLECDGSPVLVQTVEPLSARLHRVYEVKKEAYLDEEPAATEMIKTERPALATAYVAPANATEEKLADIFGQFFGIDRIGTDDNFFELGGDSLKGMMLLKRVKNEFNVNITLTDFFHHQTVRMLSILVSDLQLITVKSQRTSKMVI